VIEGLGSQLSLSQRQLEPSSSTLYWYGNTSSSSLWYALSYIESRQTVHKGDKVWQVMSCLTFWSHSAIIKRFCSLTRCSPDRAMHTACHGWCFLSALHNFPLHGCKVDMQARVSLGLDCGLRHGLNFRLALAAASSATVQCGRLCGPSTVNMLLGTI